MGEGNQGRDNCSHEHRPLSRSSFTSTMIIISDRYRELFWELTGNKFESRGERASQIPEICCVTEVHPTEATLFCTLFSVFSSILLIFCSQIVSVYCYSDVFLSIWSLYTTPNWDLIVALWAPQKNVNLNRYNRDQIHFGFWVIHLQLSFATTLWFPGH